MGTVTGPPAKRRRRLLPLCKAGYVGLPAIARGLPWRAGVVPTIRPEVARELRLVIEANLGATSDACTPRWSNCFARAMRRCVR